MLVQKSTGAGRWVTLGQKYAGYTLTAYDDPSGRLTLTKDQTTHILLLKKATVEAVKTTPPSPEDQKSMQNNLRQLAAAADQYFLENGVNRVESAKLIGPNAYIRELKPVAGESYNFVIEQGQPLRIKTTSGFQMEFKN